MGKLHHTKMKYAIGKYAKLHFDGFNEAELKSEIAKDEKGFDAAAVNEIYAAIIAEDTQGDKGGDTNPGETQNPAISDETGNNDEETTDTISEEDPEIETDENQELTNDNNPDENLEKDQEIPEQSIEEKSEEIEVKTSTSKGKKAAVYTVVKEFRDKSDFTILYKIGDDVSHFDSKRLEHLINIEHVQKK